MKSIIALALGLGALALVETSAPTLAAAQTFDCSTDASSATRQTICGTDILRSLDEEVAYIIGILPAEASNVVMQEQFAFENQIEACGTDAKCIEEGYVQRMIYLNSTYRQ